MWMRRIQRERLDQPFAVFGVETGSLAESTLNRGYHIAMNFVAWKMLVGDRAKYIGIIIGLTFASLLITQQAGIFVGLMSRTYGAITDLRLPDIWVMDKKVQFIDDVKPLQDTPALSRPRRRGRRMGRAPLQGPAQGAPGKWQFQTCNVDGPGRCDADRRAAGDGPRESWKTCGGPTA